MKVKEMEAKEKEKPVPPPVVQIIKDDEMQKMTLHALQNLRGERELEKEKGEHYKKQMKDFEINNRILDSKVSSQGKIHEAMQHTINELEKEISLCKERLRVTREKLADAEEGVLDERRKCSHVEGALFDERACRERLQREQVRLEDQIREMESRCDKEKQMRHSAEYRANKNDQFSQLFSDRNGMHQTKGGPMLALTNNGVNGGDALYYKTQSEKLSKQLSTMSKQLEQADRLRRMENSSRRMDSGIISMRDMSGMNRTQDMLMMNRSLLSSGGGRTLGDGDYSFKKYRQKLKTSMDLTLNSSMDFN